mgnify:CR=1 FL=1
MTPAGGADEGSGRSVMKARIYQPAKTAMQSGRGKRKWILEFEPVSRRAPEPLMGWIGSSDTTRQVRLRFDTREEAVAYAERNGLDYVVDPAPSRTVRPKSYADNFRHDRIGRWTH